ncbi:hypothetical protein OHA70_14510 [Kribbella sp. NBC_00382]|uniref:hypothetical protein n=1 Tax=Kribbella sp. NBC_00382 TaxID=2975967 RepID=UPI002E2300F0
MPRLLTATVALALVITGCSITTTNPSDTGTPQPTQAGTPQPAAAGTPQATATDTSPSPSASTSQAPARTTPFEIVAGGGTNAFAEKALDAQIKGAVWDLEFAPDGTANLLINDGKLRLQRIRPDGTLTKVELGYGQVGRRIAVGPDGSAYVNLHSGEKADAVYRIKVDGSQTQVIGFNAAVAGIDDRPGETTGKFTAFTIDSEGHLVFAANVTKDGTAGAVVRRVGADGSVRTIAGKPTEFTTLDAAKAASPASLHPTASGSPLDWPTTAAVLVDKLATRPDGTIALEVVASDSGAVAESILALSPAGKLSELATSQLNGSGGAAVAPAPFTREGAVQDIGVIYSGLSVADGLLAVSTSKHPPEDTSLYYNGQYTPTQQAILREARAKAIRLIRADGSFSTAALGAEFALHGGYLYVVCRDFLADELVLGRVKIPA